MDLKTRSDLLLLLRRLSRDAAARLGRPGARPDRRPGSWSGAGSGLRPHAVRPTNQILQNHADYLTKQRHFSQIIFTPTSAEQSLILF